jgi:hypothetical protein
MKRVVIFDTYPSGQKEVDMLRESVKSFKGSGWDSLIVSHLPIDEETSKLATYVIYDSNNTFLPAEYTPFYWLSNPSFSVKIFNAGHALAISRNINTSLHLAKALKYDQFVFTESDVVMHPEDLQKLVGYMDGMTEQNKKMMFFKPEGYRDNGSYVYETLLFGGDVNYFLDTFVPPLDVDEWMSVPMGYTFELSFYERFSHDEDKFYILNDHSSNIFDKSGVNLLRYGLFNCEMVYNETSPERPILFISNSLIINECRFIDILINGQPHTNTYVSQGMYWLNEYGLDDSELTVNVYNEDGSYLYFTKKFLLNQDNQFKNKGTIKFNNYGT